MYTDQQANHPVFVRSKLAADLNFIAHRMQRDADEFGTARDAGDDEVEVAYNAIERARELNKLIRDALTLAAHPTMPSDIAMEVRTCLHLLHETLGQPDVPARMELAEGRPDDAIDELHEAMMRGWEECGRQLNLLAAKLRASLSSTDQRAPTNASCGSASDDNRRLSVAELASEWGIKNRKALDERLRRWRKNNPDKQGEDWFEVERKDASSTRYLFRVGAVSHLLHKGERGT